MTTKTYFALRKKGTLLYLPGSNKFKSYKVSFIELKSINEEFPKLFETFKEAKQAKYYWEAGYWYKDNTHTIAGARVRLNMVSLPYRRKSLEIVPFKIEVTEEVNYE